VLSVDPGTGDATIIGTGGMLVSPIDVTIDENGDFIVVDIDAFEGTGGIIKIDSEGGQTEISSGGNFMGPNGVAIDANGDIIVANLEVFGGSGSIIKVDPSDGMQTIVSTDDPFDPAGIVVFVDTDGDGVVDSIDNCPTDFNPKQRDGDNDGVGNVCDDTRGDKPTEPKESKEPKEPKEI